MKKYIFVGILFSLTSVHAQEYHPRLLFSESDIPTQNAKLNGNPIEGRTGPYIVATFEDRLHANTLTTIQDALNSNDGTDIYRALKVFDVQHKHIPEPQRTQFRTGFLDYAEEVYNLSEGIVDGVPTGSIRWWFRERSPNNWTYRHAGYPLQILLYTGIMFPDDPDGNKYRDKGMELLRWTMESSPNNGMYNRNTDSWDVRPTVVDAIDETIGAPNNYGLYGSHNFVEIMHIVDRNVPGANINWYGNMWHSESKFWTYNLSYLEAEDWDQPNSSGWDSWVSYGGANGHGRYRAFHSYSNHYLLYWAYRLNEPVFAWHYYANPGTLRRVTFKDHLAGSANPWTAPVPITRNSSGNHTTGFRDYFHFISWGEVAPEDPNSAGWPLTEFWENAGVAIMRKSWTKNQRVVNEQGMPDEPRGKVWLHAGPAGSKMRFTIGSVTYEADDTRILTSGPWECSCPNSPDFLNESSLVHNGLVIDGEGHHNPNNLVINRRRYGNTTRLAENTFLMDMRNDPNRTDFHDYFDRTSYNVDWTRKIHFDRERDILWIKDVASTDDNQSHQFRFNWISPDPRARAGDNTVYDLPANYKMVVDSNETIAGGIHRYGVDSHSAELPGTDFDYSAVRVGANANSVTMLWAISKNEAEAREFIQKNRGVFVSNVVFSRQPDGIHIFWDTDESSQGRVEYGLTTGLGSQVVESQAINGTHEVILPDNTADYFYRIVAADTHGDETIDDNNGNFYTTNGAGLQAPVAPSNLRINANVVNGIGLEWNDNSNNEARFEIERRTETDPYEVITTINPDGTEYHDLTVTRDVEYTYRIAALNIVGPSSYSNEVKAILSSNNQAEDGRFVNVIDPRNPRDFEIPCQNDVRVLDRQGAELLRLVCENGLAIIGQNQTLASGIYTVLEEGLSLVRRFVVLR